ncbi:integrin alpha-4 [Lates japonicus]|uniref:Integrin alpha-4 n=1 Tax=Lates japonicus TaxID=270547 RepID=A0AAD3N8R4_LATJO|nr:integrin alpha-4 [Lates japonicus]
MLRVVVEVFTSSDSLQRERQIISVAHSDDSFGSLPPDVFEQRSSADINSQLLRNTDRHGPIIVINIGCYSRRCAPTTLHRDSASVSHPTDDHRHHQTSPSIAGTIRTRRYKTHQLTNRHSSQRGYSSSDLPSLPATPPAPAACPVHLINEVTSSGLNAGIHPRRRRQPGRFTILRLISSFAVPETPHTSTIYGGIHVTQSEMHCIGCDLVTEVMATPADFSAGDGNRTCHGASHRHPHRTYGDWSPGHPSRGQHLFIKRLRPGPPSNDRAASLPMLSPGTHLSSNVTHQTRTHRTLLACMDGADSSSTHQPISRSHDHATSKESRTAIPCMLMCAAVGRRMFASAKNADSKKDNQNNKLPNGVCYRYGNDLRHGQSIIPCYRDHQRKFRDYGSVLPDLIIMGPRTPIGRVQFWSSTRPVMDVKMTQWSDNTQPN